MSRLLTTLTALSLASTVGLALLYVRASTGRDYLAAHLQDATTRNARLESQTDALQQKVTSLDSALGESRSKLTEREAESARLARDLAQTKAALAEREQAVRALGTELAGLKQDLDSARNSAVGPEAVAAYKNTIAELERQLARVSNGAAVPTAPGASTAVFTSRAGRSAPVVSVGPGNSFVVLSYGSTRGARLAQTLPVNRGTDQIATVLITEVRTQFSIAQVEPGSLHGDLHKGDLALIPASP